MSLLRVIEIASLILGALLVLSQMAVPLIRGTKMFPLFRRQHKLENELREVKQEQVEEDIASDVAREKSRLGK